MERWELARGRGLSLDRARVLAILNVTPDSFSDGGAIASPAGAAEAARRALAEGADMLDVGGESTRPGAARVGAEEQLRRVVPAIRAIRAAGIDAPVSVDTTLADVAGAAIEAGADAVNDVSAGTEDPGMLALVARLGVGVVLMHRLRPPGEDVYSTGYDAPPLYEGGAAPAVLAFLRERFDAAMAAGVRPEAVALDPGLGFGKSVEQNLELIAHARELCNLGPPVVCGASRKSFVGALTGVQTPRDRVHGSIAAAVAMRLGGAALFRVHDVAAHARALAVADALLDAGGA